MRPVSLALLAILLIIPTPARSEEKSDAPVVTSVSQLMPVMAAALSGDGRWIAVALEDHATVLWDTTVGRPVRTLAGHPKAVLSLSFSPDHRQLLSGSADGTAALWDTATGDRVQTFRGHTGSVLSVAFSPDGSRCLTGSDDGTARVWRTKAGEAIHTLKAHTKEVMAVAYSPDGTTLATASADATAILWDADTGKKTATLVGHKEGVSCVCFSRDGRRVGTGSWENFGIVWDRTTGQKITATPRQNNDVYAVAFTADSRHVLTAGREELIVMSDAATGEKLRTLSGHTADIVNLAVGLGGKVLLSGSRDGTVKLWELTTGRELLTLATDSSRKSWAAVAPDGLLDASEAGRRTMGFRFAKPPMVTLDQLFEKHYHPGLLAEVAEGKRPAAAKPFDTLRLPLVTIVPPKSRVSRTQEVTLAVDVSEGDANLVVEINGVRVAAVESATTRANFTVSLAPGTNKIRVKASARDRSCESAPAEIDLAYPRAPEQKSRMYVVAVGSDEPIRGVAELLRTRGAKLYDRVDVVPLSDRNATKAAIEDTVKDVAELTQPQDAVVVLLAGSGDLLGDRLTFSPHGVAVSDLTAALGTAKALKRALVIDLVPTAAAARPRFALRGAVERMARAHGVHVSAALTAKPGFLHTALASVPAGDVGEWFRLAEEKAGRAAKPLAGPPPDLQISSQARGFPILVIDK